jgi:hypothetical protein
MATIGKITGPMLVANLQRDGINLSIDDGLIYFDVINKRLGVNTQTPTVELNVVGSANITGNLFVGNTITIGTSYTLPPEAPDGFGQVLTAEGPNSMVTYWAPGAPESGIRRRRYEKTISSLAGFGTAEFVLNIGVSSIVYAVSVSRPVQVEVFSTPAKDEPNPYTFIATPDHLTDDGTVILNDGSSFQSRQYSIFSNLEEPPQPNVFVTLTSLDSYQAGTPITFSVFYFPAVTDGRPATEVLTALPTTHLYEGKTVFDTSSNKLNIWVNGAWRTLN